MTTETSSGTSRALPTYEEAASRLGVRLCTGGCSMIGDSHRRGVVMSQGEVHWGPPGRRPNRKGLYAFLKLVAIAQDISLARQPRWYRIYSQSKTARRLAAKLGFRITRDGTNLDRAKVRFLLADPETRDTPLKEKVWRWAEKRYD